MRQCVWLISAMVAVVVGMAVQVSAADAPVRHRAGRPPARAVVHKSAKRVAPVAPSGTKHAKARPGAHARTALAPRRPLPPCLHDAVQFERGFGATPESIVLTRCDGRPAPKAIEQLSILARPMNVPRPQLPTTPALYAGKSRGEWAYGVKLVDEGLLTRLQKVVDHFRVKKLVVVSGYRPTSLGSLHQSAKALDFRLEGASNEALVAYCRKLPDTGCGYYPNSSFVHMDVRPGGTGHVYWIDASGPGDPAHYVSSWPPPKDELGHEIRMTRRIPALPLDDTTHPDLFPPLPAGASDSKVDARTADPTAKGDPFRP